MMRDGFLVFGSPVITDDEINEVVDSMRSAWLGTGPKVARFEELFASYKGVPNAAAVNSCTAALHLSLLASGLEPGDEVITTPLTFCATVNAIIHAGATPVLADIDPLTMNIDPAAVAAKITTRTKAILPVHFAGRPCEMDELDEISKKHGLKMIEDCAHAIETEYKNRKAGTIGDFGCFSFYVTKNIVTGEGGMVLSRRNDDLSRIKILALHGMSKDAWKRFSDEGYRHYQVVECGFKYNMMDLQAAIGLRQMEKMEQYWLRRKEIWERYGAAFSDLPVSIPAEIPDHMKHAYHLYTLLVDESISGISRDEFIDAMHKRNIGTGVHYISLPEHPYYQAAFGWRPEDYPNAMYVGRKTVSIPLSAKLSDRDVDYVIESVRGILKKN